MLALGAGKAATKSQVAVMEDLGLEAVGVAKAMQLDAKGRTSRSGSPRATPTSGRRRSRSTSAAAPVSTPRGGRGRRERLSFSSRSEIPRGAARRAGGGVPSGQAGLALALVRVEDPFPRRIFEADIAANMLQLTRNTTAVGTEMLPALNRALDVILTILRAVFEWSVALDALTGSRRSSRPSGWGGKNGLLTLGWEGSNAQSAWQWATGRGEGDAPGRATGGPVRAGQVYRWRENGAEMFQPATDGVVIAAREMRALRASAPTSRNATFNATFHITAAPGMSPQDIAREIDRRLRQLTRSGSPLHDGGAYA